MRGGHCNTSAALCRRQLGNRLHAVFRIHMDRAHEPSRLVGSDRQDRHIERSTAVGDGSEFGMKGGVPSEKQRLKRGTERPPACLLYTSDAADDLLCVDL